MTTRATIREVAEDLSEFTKEMRGTWNDLRESIRSLDKLHASLSHRIDALTTRLNTATDLVVAHDKRIRQCFTRVTYVEQKRAQSKAIYTAWTENADARATRFEELVLQLSGSVKEVSTRTDDLHVAALAKRVSDQGICMASAWEAIKAHDAELEIVHKAQAIIDAPPHMGPYPEGPAAN